MTIRVTHAIQVTLCLLLIAILSSCTHVKKDGPPAFYVDETKIPNAVPKPTRLARTGNMPVYQVFGKRYYVMRSSRYYEAVGTASWYGTKFHNRYTSSGERYNMLGMTAAHRTLPLPTYVEVTNLRNHRKIIVKVNDRGPFEGNRLIDLSYVAAKKLRMLGPGTTTVRVRAIDPHTYANENLQPSHPFNPTHRVRSYPFVREQIKAAAPLLAQRKATTLLTQGKATNKALYYQVGAFRNVKNAEQLKSKLVKLGMPASIIAGNFYRVRIGPFRDHLSFNKMRARLRGLNIKSPLPLAGSMEHHSSPLPLAGEG